MAVKVTQKGNASTAYATIGGKDYFMHELPAGYFAELKYAPNGRKYFEVIEQKDLDAQEATSKAEEDAARAELDKTEQEMTNLQRQIQEEMTAGQAQIAKTKAETEVTQRETGERRLARLRARIRSTSRPLLSKGVSL